MGLSGFLEDAVHPVSSVDLTKEHSSDLYLPDPKVAKALRNRARDLAKKREEMSAMKPEKIKPNDVRKVMEGLETLLTDCVKACVRDEKDEEVEAVLEMRAAIPGVQLLVDRSMMLCGVGNELRQKGDGVGPLGGKLPE